MSAAVAITVRGQSALTPTPRSRNSSAIPSTHMLMPYLAIVYATCGANQRGFIESGGESIRTCGFGAFSSQGRHACVQRNVPRAFTWCMRSQRFMGVFAVSPRWMALALLTRTSIPPKRPTAWPTAACTCSSSRMSQATASAFPPARSTSSAAVWIVPGSFGFGTSLLAAITTFAPSRAAAERDAPCRFRGWRR